MAEIVLEQLTKAYRDVPEVAGIDLHVRHGELLVLVGPSGCGKTTTLRMIAGLEVPTSGRIRIGARVVNDLPPRDRNVAMVFQQGALYPHLNVYQNLAFGLKLRHTSRAEIESRVAQAAKLLGLDGLLERQPWELSGGQRQRVAVGRAIVRRPEAFLFDEPLSSLDAQLRAGMRSELVKLHRRLESTTLHVTHDQVEALTMGDRIAVMRAGRLQQVGTPQEVYDLPANRFVAEFLGSPPMRFLSGVLQLESGNASLRLASHRLTLAVEHRERWSAWHGRPVLLGVRPEAVRLVPPAVAPGLWTQLPAQITLVQALGSETIVDLDCGGAELSARAEAGRPCRCAEILDVYLNTAACHLFDPTTGVRL